MKPYSFLLSALFSCLLAGCASNSTVDAIRRDLHETRERVQNMEKDVHTASDVAKNLKNDFDSLRKSDADLFSMMDSTKMELQVLSARLEDISQSQKKNSDDLKRYRDDTDRRLVMIEDRIVKLQAALDEMNKRVHEGMATGPAQTDESRPDALYLKGLELFKANNMAAARTSLAQFIEQHPSHELVPNARYWIGETYYSEKNYEQAILEFQEVIKLYPKKDKAPAAMLKQALSFKALKDIKSSRYVLNRLVQDYPKSDEAKKARVLLKELK